MQLIQKAIEIARKNGEFFQESRSERRKSVKKERYKNIPLSGKMDQSPKKK